MRRSICFLIFLFALTTGVFGKEALTRPLLVLGFENVGLTNYAYMNVVFTKSLITFLSTIPKAQIVEFETLKNTVYNTNELWKKKGLDDARAIRIAESMKCELVIYGDFRVDINGGTVKIHLYLIDVTTKKRIFSEYFVATTDVDIFTTVDEMIAIVRRNTVGEEITTGSIVMDTTDNGYYMLVINNDEQGVVSRDRPIRKSYPAGSNYNVRLKLAGTEYEFFNKDVFVEFGKTVSLNFVPTNSVLSAPLPNFQMMAKGNVIDVRENQVLLDYNDSDVRIGDEVRIYGYGSNTAMTNPRTREIIRPEVDVAKLRITRVYSNYSVAQTDDKFLFFFDDNSVFYKIRNGMRAEIVKSFDNYAAKNIALSSYGTYYLNSKDAIRGKLTAVDNETVTLDRGRDWLYPGETVRVLSIETNADGYSISNKTVMAKLRVTEIFDSYSMAKIDNFGKIANVAPGMTYERLEPSHIAFYKDYFENIVSLYAIYFDNFTAPYLKYTRMLTPEWGLNVSFGTVFKPYVEYGANNAIVKDYSSTNYTSLRFGGTYRPVFGDFDYLALQVDLGLIYSERFHPSFVFDWAVLVNFSHFGIYLEWEISGADMNDIRMQGGGGGLSILF